MKAYYISILITKTLISCNFSNKPIKENKTIITGAAQTLEYIHYLKGKRVAILANQTSVIGSTHLVDSLMSSNISLTTIFAPEHGFRGNYSAGIEFEDDAQSIPGVNIISLYGSKTIPSKEDLSNIDIVIFDIQDVGCRFYTYINILRNIMYSCAKYNIELLILDRPNPNGYLVDGPILDMELKSGIGQFPIPIAHGMTIAEFARMINGEYWLQDSLQCPLKIVPLKNYSHAMAYTLPIAPSPNLNTQQSILLYPSTCLFEGTILNHGRGTLYPFTIIGSPELKGKFKFSFIPISIPGMSETPLHMNEVCYGIDLRAYNIEELKNSKRINIQWMIDLYNAYPQKENFFNSQLSNQIGSIELLTGTTEFKEQIQSGKTVLEIQNSWEPELSEYKQKRKKYLLYP